MRPLFAVLRHVVFASLTATSHGLLGVSNDKSVLGINNEFSAVCYTYVSVYPVLADVPDYITITKPYRGSVTALYTVPPQGDEPGIIIVEQPGGSSAPENVVIPATYDRSYVIIIRPHQGPDPITAPTTQVIPPRSGQPGQIIIETPETQVEGATPGVLQPLTLQPHEATGYVTVLQPLNGTLASLQLITLTPTGTNRGTVIVNIPAASLDLADAQSLTIQPAEDGDYVTIVEPAGTSFAGTAPVRLTVAPSDGRPGTVIIQTPAAGILRPVRLEALAFTTLNPLGGLAGQSITIQPTDATGFVTIIEPAEGIVLPTAPIVTTILPTGTKPGTVLIQTPPEGNGRQPGGSQATGEAGADFPSSRGRPAGSVSYTTITRGVPLGFGGDDGDSGADAAGGVTGGSDDSQDEDGATEDDNSGNAEGRPGQGQAGDGPRQTITIPPEGGNPGTVLVLTPDDPDNPQTDSNDADDSPAGNQPMGSDGDDEESAQATGGSRDGTQDGSGEGSNNDSPETGSGSGNTSGRPGQGSSSGSGGSESKNNDDSQGSVQGIGSGSSGDDEDNDPDNSGSSGSSSGNTSGRPGQGSSSGNGGSESNNNDDSQGSVQGIGSGSSGDDEDNDPDNSESSGSSSGNTSGRPGQGSSSGNGGSESNDGGSQGSVQGIGSGSSGDDEDNDSENTGSSGSNSGNDSGNGSSDSSDGQDPDNGSSEGNDSSSGSQNEDDQDGSDGSSGSSSGSTGSNGGDVDEDEDADTGENEASGNAENSRNLSRSGSRTSQRRTGTRSPVVTTSPTTYTVTSSNSVITITSDVVRTVANDKPRSTRSKTSNKSSSDKTWSVDVGKLHGMGGSTRSDLTKTTFKRPSNSQTTTSVVSATTSANGDVIEETSASGAQSRSLRTGSSSGSSDPDFSTSLDDQTRTGGSSLSSSSSKTTSSVDQGNRSSKDETTIVDSGPVETNAPESVTRASTLSSRGGPTNVLSTGQTKESTAFQSTSSQRPAASSASTSSKPLIGEPEGFGTNAGDNDGETASTSTRRSSGASTSASAPDVESLSISSSRTSSGASRNEETTTQRSDNGSSSQSTRAGTTSTVTSIGSSATSIPEVATSPDANTRPGGGSLSQSASAGSSILLSSISTGDSTSDFDRGNTQSQSSRSSSASQATTQRTTSSEEGVNLETLVGSQSVAESDRVELGDETSSSLVTSGTSTVAARTTISTDGTGGSTTIRQSDSQSTNINEDISSSQSGSGGSGVTGQPAGGVGGSETDGVGDGDTSAIESASNGEENTERPTDDSTSDTVGRSPTSGDDSETPAPSVTGSQDTQEVEVSSTETSGSDTPTSSSNDDGNEDGQTEAASSNGDDAQVSETDAGIGSETSDSAAPTSSSDSDGNEDGQTEASSLSGNNAPVSETDTDADVETSESAVPTGASGPRSDPISETEESDPTTVVSAGEPIVAITEISQPTDAIDSEAATITVFKSGSGAERTTLYIPPQSSDDAWTVVIVTPVSETQSEAATARGDGDILATASAIGGNTNVTLFRAGSSPARRTIYISPQAADQPGTIIIETPVITAPIATSTTTATLRTGEDSVRDSTTVYSGGSGSVTRTVIISATATDEPDTVVIVTPTSGSSPSNVTIYTGVSATVATTRFMPGAASDDPGTLIIETPIDASRTEGPSYVTIFSGGPGTAVTTIYLTPGASGDSTTMVIQTPTQRSEAIDAEESESITGSVTGNQPTTAPSAGNVTIYTQAPGTVGGTFYFAPDSPEESGTVIIETLQGDTEETGGSSLGTATTTAVGSRTNTTVYSGGPVTAIRTLYISATIAGEPDTVLIETPIASSLEEALSTGSERTNTTIFVGGSFTATRTVFISATVSGEPDTVLVETPTGTLEDVEAETGLPTGVFNVTISQGGPGSVATTVYVAGESGQPGTVIIQTPTESLNNNDPAETSASPANITLTQGGPGSVATTIYIPGASGQPGTVIIETPTGSTNSQEASGTSVGQGEVTITRGGPASAATTITIPGVSGQPDTVLIETPTRLVNDQTSTTDDIQDDLTITRGGPVSVATTITILGISGQPDTVLIQTPTGLVNDQTSTTDNSLDDLTITRGGPVSVATTITISGISGQPGTVLVQTPTGSGDGQDTSETDGSQDDVTITRGGPVSVVTTVTIPGVSGQADTVLIETPTEVTDDEASTTGNIQDEITIITGGPASVTTTITIPGQSGQPDTVLIETPTGSADDQEVTETSSSQNGITITTGGPVSVAITITIPGQSGQPDTVLIETPTGAFETPGNALANVTVYSDVPGSVTQTLYIPPTASGEAGTVVIQIPTGGTPDDETDTPQITAPTAGIPVSPQGRPNTTVYSGGSVSAATTIYISATVSGEPDIIFIQTPTAVDAKTDAVSGTATGTLSESNSNVTITSGGSASTTRTVYFPPASDDPDGPGTVVIETPTSGAEGPANVTRFVGGPVSVTTTIYIPPTASDEAGTVIIQTPTSEPDETASATEAQVGGQNTTIYSGGPGSVATTIYYPPASDDPDKIGTVVVQTPTAGPSEDENGQTSSGTASQTSAPVQNITSYVGGPYSVTTTIYIPPTAPGEPGTVLIATPTSNLDQVTSASITESVTGFEPPIGLQNVTRFVGGPDSITTTIYILPTAVDEPGTVLIQTPTSSPDNGDSSSASVTDTFTSVESPTVVQNVTRFVGGPASVMTTVYIPPAVPGDPGTVLIQTPTAASSEEISPVLTSESVTSTDEPSAVQNVTRFVGGPASVTTTVYIPPAVPGDPGTVLIQIPSTASNEETSSVITTTSIKSAEEPSVVQNVTRFVGGPASVTTTIYLPPVTSGDPGTVLIQTPTAASSEETSQKPTSESITSVEEPSAVQNVTRFVGGPASVTTTIYLPPAVSGDPGTVVIQTPTADPSSEIITSSMSSSIIQNVTSFIGGPASVTTTIYVPPTAPNEPGTVLIQTPTSTPGETSTSEVSSTTSPPVAVQNVTLIVGGPASVITTIYIPPAASGDPGTVLIQTPTSAPTTSTVVSTTSSAVTTTTPAVVQNVTIYGDGTGSITRTIYIPPVSEGDPGTVLIETPTAAPDISTVSSTAVVVPPTTSSSSAIPVASSSTSAATSSSSSSAAAAVPTTTSSSSAVVIPPTTSSSVVIPLASSSIAAVSSSSSSAAVVPASSSSSAAVVLPPTTTSAAVVVVTTSTSAAAVVSTTSTSTSMMPQASFGPTFDCNGYGYVLSSLLSNTLTRVNLVTGDRVTIKSGVGPGGAINGIGFNPIDNYIYGFVTQPLLKNLLCGLLGCPQSQLIRIANDGRYEVLPLILTTNAISMGDVDNQGILWVSEGGNKWWSVDLRRGANFGKLISSGTSNIDLLSGVGDWAYVPGGGSYLYSVQASVIESGLLRTNIVRWSLVTQKWERYQSYPGLLLTALNLIWGAVVAAPGGVLFAQENLLGQTWRFTLGSTDDPTAIQGGAILNLSGDGAKCASGAL
ncbi:hypothetical protein ACHAPU_001940 [Fusarium lateritium]